MKLDGAEQGMKATSLEAYNRLRRRGREALRQGHLQQAFELFSAARDVAEALSDPVLQDRSFCNLAAIELELSPSPTLVPRLRDILVRNQNVENCRLAAYHLARAYELRGEHKKGAFYSRIAQERSLQTGKVEWIASSRNQLGNLLLAESRTAEAEREFAEALDLLAAKDDPLRALILDNLAYCAMLRKQWALGFRSAFDSLRMLRRLGTQLWEPRPHLTLCFGYLELGRARHAFGHARRALELSEKIDDAGAVKNALFLLGEAASMAGDGDEAYRQFADLQRRFYPDHDYLASFLLSIDVRGLVNLKA